MGEKKQRSAKNYIISNGLCSSLAMKGHNSLAMKEHNSLAMKEHNSLAMKGTVWL